MTENTFDPNQLTFEQGLERMKKVSKKVGVALKRGILTSRDKDVNKLVRALRVTNIPDGFLKWQLPVYLNKPSQLFISVATPYAKVPAHSHRDGDGIRFIVSGSIIYNNQELTAGDWMFIPAGEEYSFEVGRFGATMGYCYCCSCAGLEIPNFDEVVDPPPFIPA